MVKNRWVVDSNLLIYALLMDEIKHRYEMMVDLLKQSLNTDLFVSIQVIEEVHRVLIRKYDLKDSLIKNIISSTILPIANLQQTDLNVYEEAFDIREKYSISFWQSLIVATSLIANCSVLYSEDMAHGILIKDRLKIINPFKHTNL